MTYSKTNRKRMKASTKEPIIRQYEGHASSRHFLQNNTATTTTDRKCRRLHHDWPFERTELHRRRSPESKSESLHANYKYSSRGKANRRNNGSVQLCIPRIRRRRRIGSNLITRPFSISDSRTPFRLTQNRSEDVATWADRQYETMQGSPRKQADEILENWRENSDETPPKTPEHVRARKTRRQEFRS